MQRAVSKYFSAAALIVSMLAAASCAGGKKTVQAPCRRILLSDSLILAHRSDTIDFGRINEGEVVEMPLVIVNAGDKPFVILAAETSCGCLDPIYEPVPVQPGGDISLTLRFRSAGEAGTHLKTIHILTSLAPERYRLVVSADVR